MSFHSAAWNNGCNGFPFGRKCYFSLTNQQQLMSPISGTFFCRRIAGSGTERWRPLSQSPKEMWLAQLFSPTWETAVNEYNTRPIWIAEKSITCGQQFQGPEAPDRFISIVIALTFNTGHKSKQQPTLWFILKWRMWWLNFCFGERFSFHFSGNDINRKVNLLDMRALAWVHQEKYQHVQT